MAISYELAVAIGLIEEEDTYDEDVARHVANCKEEEYCKICAEY